MKFVLTEKDIIAMNQVFEEPVLINEMSLEYALSYAKKTENWVKALAFLTRAILLDHVFEDGNKRTTALLIKTYTEYEGYKIYDDKLLKMIRKTLLKNITSIRKIEEMIKDAIH